MNGSPDLRERLYREMLDSGRMWSASEIALATLKISCDGSRASSLVSAILLGDRRFVADRAGWSVNAASRGPGLETLSFLLCDAPPVPAGTPVAPVFVRPFGLGPAAGAETVRIGADPEDLADVSRWMEGRLCASLTAPAVRRRLHALERLHALPAASERVLDLRAALKLLGKAMPQALDPESRAETEERLDAAAGALGSVIEACGAEPLDVIEERIESLDATRPVDFTRYRFSAADLDEIPSRPGVYRFLDQAGAVLYVGKSRDLKRRVGGYFRPLAQDHQRRERLLETIRDLEWECRPSELDALLDESRLIRALRPKFNQQIETGRGDSAIPVGTDLAFVLCEGDPENVSVHFLVDGLPWARATLPRAPIEATRSQSRRIAASWSAAEIGPESGMLVLDETDRILVSRYLLHNGDAVDRVERPSFPDSETLADAFVELAIRPRPSWEPWSMRGAALR